MYLIMRYTDGEMVEGVVLSAYSSLMRLALRGCNDAVELTYTGRQWVAETGEKVDFEFVGAGAAHEVQFSPACHISQAAS